MSGSTIIVGLVVIFVLGGAWQRGSPSGPYVIAGLALVAGLAALTGYRPESEAPLCVHDRRGLGRHRHHTEHKRLVLPQCHDRGLTPFRHANLRLKDNFTVAISRATVARPPFSFTHVTPNSYLTNLGRPKWKTSLANASWRRRQKSLRITLASRVSFASCCLRRSTIFPSCVANSM